jgi:cytochrome c biogenesis protein CcdA
MCFLILFPVHGPVAGPRADEGHGEVYIFYSETCSHCKKALLFLSELRERYPQVTFHEFEIVKNRENQIRFMELHEELDIKVPGVPVWVVGSDYLVGYKDTDLYRRKIMGMIERQLSVEDAALLEAVEGRSLSLPLFTVLIGLADGVNPCALWVLMFLLTLLVNTGDRSRMAVVGITFVVTSAVVYLLFMIAWLNFFTLLGYREIITIVFAAVIVVIGLINMKELFFFKRGVSLMIPERFKPRIVKRMRGIMESPSMILSIGGTLSLAFFVNLVEFGCTVGLPAVYTKVLADQGLSPGARYLYMILYNIAYMVPLLAVVLLFLLSFRKFQIQERHGRVLKVVSGTLMLTLGIILLVDPGLLVF